MVLGDPRHAHQRAQSFHFALPHRHSANTRPCCSSAQAPSSLSTSLHALKHSTGSERVDALGRRAVEVIICIITRDFSVISNDVTGVSLSLSLSLSQKSLTHNIGSASALPIIRDCIQLYQLRSSCCTIHGEFAVEACTLESFEIFRHEKRCLYGIHLHTTRGGGGGHLLAEWRAFEISQSLNFEHVFQDCLKLEKKLDGIWMCSTTWRKKILIEQIFVKRWSFESKSSFFKQKSFKKELLIGKVFCYKKVCPFKGNRKWGSSIRKNFTFVPVVKGFPSTSFSWIPIEIETVVMTSRSKKLAHLEISLRLITGEKFA